MLVSSIVRFTLGIKDHRVVSTELANNELRIELDVKKRRTLPCSICGKQFHRRISSERGAADTFPSGGLLSFSTIVPGELNAPSMALRWNGLPGTCVKKPISFFL